MQHSESLTKLAAALAKAQGEMENAAKSSDNPFFRSKYADLAEIINTARPVLAKHGLSIVQIPGFDGTTVSLENILLHESGEWISGIAGAPMPVMTTKDGRELPPSPQGIGSAVTYMRRYSMAALCMIAQEDDDGNAASHGHGARQEAAKYAAPAYHAERAGAEQAQPQPRPSEPVGVQHSNVKEFDLDAVAPGKKAGGKTWRQLLADDDGRGFVRWAIKEMRVLDFTARETLTVALGAAELGDPDFSREFGGEPLKV